MLLCFIIETVDNEAKKVLGRAGSRGTETHVEKGKGT
jgi:hypothetical protein